MTTRPARAAVISTAGGHLTQSTGLAPRVGVDPHELLWVTGRVAEKLSSPELCDALVQADIVVGHVDAGSRARRVAS